MRALVPVALCGLTLLLAPGVASADAIFDQADADELSSVLAEATADQDVCYGWKVSVDDQSGIGQSDSVGSDRGAGVPVDTSACSKYVRLDVFITWTSESSESEDSASYDVSSSSGGPNRDDMDALELDLDELDGDNPDVPIAKMIAALPLLAADKGMTQLVAATPDTAEAPADAALTDDPGSDWWRENGGMFLWGMGLLLAGGVFTWWVLRTSRGRAGRQKPRPVVVPDTVPAEFYEEPARTEPPTEPFTKPTDSDADAEKPAVPVEPSPATDVESPEVSVVQPAGAGPAGDGEPSEVPAERPAGAGPVESVYRGPAGEGDTPVGSAVSPAGAVPAGEGESTEISAVRPAGAGPAEPAAGSASPSADPSTSDEPVEPASPSKPAAPADQNDKE